MAENCMDSLDLKCNDLKHAYDSCFNTWFSETFLKGGNGDASNGTPCDAMLKAYSDCVKEAMKTKNMDHIVYGKHWEEMQLNSDGATSCKNRTS